MKGRFERGMLLSAFWAVAACGSATTSQLKNRAVIDLNCSASELKIQKIDSRTQTVTGCGKRFTYIEACDIHPATNTMDCTWVVNSARDLEPSESTEVVGDGGVRAGAATEPEVAELEISGKTGDKELRLHLAAQGWHVHIRARPHSDVEVATLVVRASNAPDCQIKLVADGTRLSLNGLTEKTGATDDYTQYRTGLPYASLAAMAAGTRVIGRVCDTELTFNKAHLAKLVELVTRIREEQAWEDERAPEQPSADAPTQL